MKSSKNFSDATRLLNDHIKEAIVINSIRNLFQKDGIFNYAFTIHGLERMLSMTVTNKKRHEVTMISEFRGKNFY